MAFSTSEIDTLKAALGSGVLRVRYEDGREVVYRSLAEIREIIRMAESETGTQRRPANSVAGF